VNAGPPIAVMHCHLSHASCPAKDLTVLRLEYTVLIADHYSTDHFPEFYGFKWRLLDPSVLEGLLDALDLQVFSHFRSDENSPPDRDKYAVEAVNTCLLVERSPHTRYVLPKVQRLMYFTVEPLEPYNCCLSSGRVLRGRNRVLLRRGEERIKKSRCAWRNSLPIAWKGFVKLALERLRAWDLEGVNGRV
jgi:hypothetical protein